MSPTRPPQERNVVQRKRGRSPRTGNGLKASLLKRARKAGLRGKDAMSWYDEVVRLAGQM